MSLLTLLFYRIIFLGEKEGGLLGGVPFNQSPSLSCSSGFSLQDSQGSSCLQCFQGDVRRASGTHRHPWCLGRLETPARGTDPDLRALLGLTGQGAFWDVSEGSCSFAMTPGLPSG